MSTILCDNKYLKKQKRESPAQDGNSHPGNICLLVKVNKDSTMTANKLCSFRKYAKFSNAVSQVRSCSFIIHTRV